MTGYWVREARRADLTGVRSLARRISRELRLPRRRPVDPWSGGEAGLLWVVEQGRGRIVGSCAVSEGASGTWRLHSLFLDPQLRGRGLGRSLVEHALDQVRRQGGLRVVFLAPPAIEEARLLLERLGFRDHGAEQHEGRRVLSVTVAVAS